MKKIIVIRVIALVILCGCIICGVCMVAHNDKIEEAVNYTLNYVEDTYGSNVMSIAYDLNENVLDSWQTLFNEDISDCDTVIIVYDANGDFIDCFAVEI